LKDSPLSPIDDRYYEEVRELTPFFSQESLVQERARIELEYLSFLMRVGVAPSSKIPALEVSYEEVKGLEADLGHDVKALEVHLVNRLRASGREELAPFVHLGLTSEDVNNLAYARLLLSALKSVMIPAYEKHFTKGDMDALTAFYSAPTGQKILKEMPAIMSEAMETMMPIMRRSIDRMTEGVQEQVTQMKKGSTKGAEQNAPPAKN